MTHIIGPTTVEYNRQTGMWNARTVHATVSFPAGQDGLNAAYQLAIGMADPELAILLKKLIRYQPQLKPRAIKAALMIIDKLDMPPEAHQRCAVTRYLSQSRKLKSDLIHTVYRSADCFTCTCEDFQDGPVPWVQDQSFCKHIIATMFLLKLGRLEYTVNQDCL